MKRNFSAAAGVFLGSLMLATAAEADVTVTLSGAGNAQTFEMFEQFAARYNAQANGVTVKWIGGQREASDLQQQLLRDNLVGKPLPDMVMFTGPLLRMLQERGLAIPLDPFIKADAGWDQHFSPGVSAAGKVGGETYGLAYGVSVPIVAFNSALVGKAGGDPKNLPRDWPGITDLAKKINGLGANTVGGFLEHDNGIAFSWLFMLESQGGSVMDAADKTFTFQGAEGLKALQVLQDFGKAGQAKADMTRDQARQAFGAGGIGVHVTMSSLLPNYEKAAAGKFDVVSVPFPVAANGGRLPASAVIGAMLARDAAVQKATFDFMKFIAGPQGQLSLATTTGYAPSNRIAIEQSDDLKNLLAKRPNALAYLDNIDKISSWYVVPGDNGLRIADMFMEHMQQVVTLDETPEAALKSMGSQAQSLLKR